ncbi:hypothetical protein GFC01_13470, partial [Desulfofundulus thermobenzoicus]
PGEGRRPGDGAITEPAVSLNEPAIKSSEALRVLTESVEDLHNTVTFPAGCAGSAGRGEVFSPPAGGGRGKGNSPGGRMHPVLAGILISLSNPYWSLWWATVGLGYIVLSLKQGVPGLASFFSGHILSDLAWYGLVAAAVAGGRRFLTPVLYRGILVACGFFLIFLGGSFIFWGVRG